MRETPNRIVSNQGGNAYGTAQGIMHIQGNPYNDSVLGSANYGVMANISNLWTPSQVTTKLWLDANDSSTITSSGGSVSQWNDKSGNGINVAQLTGSQQPTIRSVNGLNYLDFVATSGQELLFGTSTLAKNIGFCAVLTIMKSDRDGTLETYMEIERPDQFSRIRLLKAANTNSLIIPRRIDNDSAPNLEFSAIPLTGTMLCSICDYANDFAWMRQNGLAETKQAMGLGSGLTSNTDSNGLAIGSRGGSNYFDGPIAEVIVTYTESDIPKLEGYAAWKYGGQSLLPVSHPYKSAPPRI